MFVDGLRFDVANGCWRRRTSGNCWRRMATALAALPSVTPTAKPAVTPAALAIMRRRSGRGFLSGHRRWQAAGDGRPVARRDHGDGTSILHGLDTGLPAGEDARAWTEHGEFDALGHKLQARLAGQIEEQLDHVLERIIHLLEAGWRTVRVITDHGWLLAPGGLPSLPLKNIWRNAAGRAARSSKTGDKRTCRRRAGFGTRGSRWPMRRRHIAFQAGRNTRTAD